MGSTGYGFREVVIDQPFQGKWMDVEMYLGGGHSTFQGTKFSDFGGGFSYKPCSPAKSIVQNRCIYWRTLNDTLELTEISMDHNLFDNQVRYIFRNSPIVGPIAIHETETNLVMLVATVCAVHKFVFIHPKKIADLPADKAPLGNNKPSIFYQICNQPQMSFRTFSLFENAINMPVPLSATCFFVQSSMYPPAQPISSMMSPQQLSNGESFFALSYENGSIQVIRISKDDTFTMFDLNQSSMFVRFFSGFTPSILRSSSTSADAVVGLSFFNARLARGPKQLYLVTLGMNGHLRLWMSSDVQGTLTWSMLQSDYITRSLIDGTMSLTDSSMLMKKSSVSGTNGLPFFVIYIPCDGFRVYNIGEGIPGQNYGGSSTNPQAVQFILQEQKRIDFKDRELVDFAVTADYIHLLVNNPEEEIEWEVKSYNLKEALNPRFNMALLEPLPLPDVHMSDDTVDPKDFYMDLVFNKCSFNKNTIIQALTMFKKEDEDLISDQEWNSLKITAMNVVDREIACVTSSTDFEMSDDDFSELCLKFWLMFYNSCVEYHLHTVKPLGLFFETNTKMLCVVKKSRISFLRPTDALETLYYFPNCVPVSESIDGGDDRMIQVQMMLKYFEILDLIDSTMDDDYREKLDRRLRHSHLMLETVCDDIANFLTEADPRSTILHQRHFPMLLAAKLKEIGELGDQALRHVNSLLLSWERDSVFVDGNVDGVEEMDTGGPMATEFLLGSRLGAHLAYKILKQLLQHRYMIARSTVILQSLCIRYFAQNNEQEGIFMQPSWEDRREALAATTYYFALLQISDDYFEYCRPMIKDRGIKVGNTLKAFTADHLKNENFVDVQWPMRLLESFCISSLGGLAIRSRVSRSKKSGILAFAEAAGRAIMPNDPTTKDHPLEEFLIVKCQYNLLLKYAQYMTTYFPGAKGTLCKFYNAIAHLCLQNFEDALNYFRSITFREACDDIYFLTKYLEFNGEEEPNPPIEMLQELYSGYYEKIIKLFGIYQQMPSMQKLSEDGLRFAPDDESATRMCSLAFKYAIKLHDYKSAYKYLMQIPDSGENDVKERKEKLACLRIFITEIVERGEVETLMKLNMSDMFNKISTVREQVEAILWNQANLSDPLRMDGVYQILYFYHISQQNFHKAAATMYFRVIQLGERGRGMDGLLCQRDSLLDVLTCLSLVDDSDFRFVIRQSGVAPIMPAKKRCLDQAKTLIPPLICDQTTLEVRSYQDVHNELLLISALIKVAQFTVPCPVKSTDFESRVQHCIDVLTQQHYYDDALGLAKAWGKPVHEIIMAYTSSCVFLQRGIMPKTGDPFDYIRNIKSDLPAGNMDVIDLAYRILQNYLNNFTTKGGDSDLYEKVTMKLLASGVELSQWLIDDYKKRNASQFLRCLMTYGEWEDAVNLVVKMIDATLGRRPAEEFDESVQKISSYDPVEPVLPFKYINLLANELKIRKEDENLNALHQMLKEKVKLFCERVEECTLERKRLYQMV